MSETIETRIEKLQADKQRELDKLNERFKQRQDAIAAELKAEITRLTNALKAAKKSYERFTGKTASRSAGDSLTNLILAEYSDGQEHRNADIIANIGADSTSAGAIIAGLRNRKHSHPIRRKKRGFSSSCRRNFVVALQT